MTCESCGIPVEIIRHEFRVGVITDRITPPTWIVDAPLYFAASPDGRRMMAPFCSAKCGAEWRLAQGRR